MHDQGMEQVLGRIGGLEQAANLLGARLQVFQQRVYALEATEAVRARGRTPRMPVKFLAQFAEDTLLWDLFGGQTEGFFIEAGAFDGVTYSVTYALEAVGWNGLLVEAIPERASACEKARPHSKVVHAALSRRGLKGDTEFTIVDDDYGGMLSYASTNATHLEAIARMRARTVRVPVACLDDLLQGVTNEVDLLVLDLEGGEVDALNGFDMARWRPKALLLEDNTQTDDTPLARAMQGHPYTFLGWHAMNRVYVRNDLRDWRLRLRGVG
jgi:FkbM family methyltransferase